MISRKKIIVELEGRAVYATRNYERARQVAWRLIYANPHEEVMVHIMGIIMGI